MFRSIVQLSSVVRVPAAAFTKRYTLKNPTTTVRYFSDSMKSGTVKWFDVKKGFGFIVPDDGSDDIFVHQTAVHAEGFRSLAEGEPVEFTTMEDSTNGKIKADNVTGPMGAYVQGAPRRSTEFNPNYGGGDESFGGGHHSGGDFRGDGF